MKITIELDMYDANDRYKLGQIMNLNELYDHIDELAQKCRTHRKHGGAFLGVEDNESTPKEVSDAVDTIRENLEEILNHRYQGEEY